MTWTLHDQRHVFSYSSDAPQYEIVKTRLNQAASEGELVTIWAEKSNLAKDDLVNIWQLSVSGEPAVSYSDIARYKDQNKTVGLIGGSAFLVLALPVILVLVRVKRNQPLPRGFAILTGI